MLIGSAAGLVLLVAGTELMGWGREWRDRNAIQSACARMAGNLKDAAACARLP